MVPELNLPLRRLQRRPAALFTKHFKLSQVTFKPNHKNYQPFSSGHKAQPLVVASAGLRHRETSQHAVHSPHLSASLQGMVTPPSPSHICALLSHPQQWSKGEHTHHTHNRPPPRAHMWHTCGFLHPSPSFDAVEGRPPPLQPPGCVQVWRGSDPLLETIMPLPSHLPACRGHLELNLLPEDSSQWTQQAPAVGAPRGPACSAAAAPGRHSHGGQ